MGLAGSVGSVILLAATGYEILGMRVPLAPSSPERRQRYLTWCNGPNGVDEGGLPPLHGSGDGVVFSVDGLNYQSTRLCLDGRCHFRCRRVLNRILSIEIFWLRSPLLSGPRRLGLEGTTRASQPLVITRAP